MIKILSRLAIPALAILASLGSMRDATAGPIFDYVSTVNVDTSPMLPDNPPGSGFAIIGIGEGNSLTFTTNTVSGIDGSLPGGADISYGTIDFNPSASSTVVNYAVNFNYEVTITDQPSGFTGTVNFTGQVKGFAKGNSKAINSSILSYDVKPKTLTLDGYKFIISVAVSNGPSTGMLGVLKGNIEVIPVPEPASILMVGLGGVGLVLIQRRRAARKQVAA